MSIFRFATAAMFLSVLMSSGLAAATDYDIDFKLTNSLGYTEVQFKVNYSSAPGTFSGTGKNVACTTNATLNSLAAYNNTSPYLKSGIIATSDFTGPVVLVTCIFSSTGGAPTAGQFTITIDDFTATHSTPPTVGISRIAVH
jgi:hypothetical protein